jgi:serine protease Do
MDDIIAHGRVRRAIMGASMQEVNSEDAAVNNLKEIAGAKIGDFSVEGSPAESAGIERGDVVLSADGKKIDRVSTLQRILRTRQPGDVVALDIVRYGDKKTFKVKLTEAPADEPRTVAANPHKNSEDANTSASVSKLGISVDALSPRIMEARRISDKVKGVVVTTVTPGSNSEGKLFENDVIAELRFPSRAPVTAVADLQRELAKLKAGQYVGLLVYSTNPSTGVATSRVVNLKIGD